MEFRNFIENSYLMGIIIFIKNPILYMEFRFTILVGNVYFIESRIFRNYIFNGIFY